MQSGFVKTTVWGARNKVTGERLSYRYRSWRECLSKMQQVTPKNGQWEIYRTSMYMPRKRGKGE